MKISLTDLDRSMALAAAEKSVYTGKIYNAKDYAVPKNKVQTHYYGYLAEIAVAKFFNVTWSGADFNTRHAGDLKNGYEVRSTQKLDGNLILGPRDNDEKPFIFVIINDLFADIIGYEYAYNIKIDENIFYRKQFPEKKWLISPSKLRSITDLLY
jgi:hypothetical protein